MLQSYYTGIPLLDTDECAEVSCQNGGSCYNTLSGSVCMCTPGFEGLLCQIGEKLSFEIIANTTSQSSPAVG